MKGIISNEFELDNNKFEESMNSSSCEICLSELSNSKESQFNKVCQFSTNKICDSCLDDWAASQLNLKSTQKNQSLIFLRCPIDTCRHLIDLESFLNRVDLRELPHLDRQLFMNTCREDPNLISCPNVQCYNIGFTNQNANTKNGLCKVNTRLICNVCEYSWIPPIQSADSRQNRVTMSRVSAALYLIKDAWASEEGMADLKSQIYKQLLSKPCNECGAFIQRNGGCKAMRCEKCQHPFCWDCGQSILFGHNQIKCAAKTLIQTAFIISPLVFAYYKTGILSFAWNVAFLPKKSSIKASQKIGGLAASALTIVLKKVSQKALAVIGLIMRLIAYHAPAKIIAKLIPVIQSFFRNRANHNNLKQKNRFFHSTYKPQKITEFDFTSPQKPMINLQIFQLNNHRRSQNTSLSHTSINEYQIEEQEHNYNRMIRLSLLLLLNSGVICLFGKADEVLSLLVFESLFAAFYLFFHHF